MLTEASLGGDNTNNVAVTRVELEGVQLLNNHVSSNFTFENGMEGQSVKE